MKKSAMPMLKNITLVLLTILCAILVVRLWFGEAGLPGLFFGELSVGDGTNPWDEDVAPLIIESAEFVISVHEGYRVFYNNLAQNSAWQDANLAIGHLVAEGVFVREGALGEHAPYGENFIAINYNFPMPSSFFREFFGTRPGFLTSHFEEFHRLIIAPSHTEDVLHFFFINKNNQDYYVFSLDSAHHYSLILDINLDTFPPTTYGSLVWSNPIHELTLSAVHNHMIFFFPIPSSVTNNTINGVYTYWDNTRIGRFYPNSMAEFTAMPTGNISDDFTQALLAAFEMLSNDAQTQRTANPAAPKNEVLLVGFRHDIQSGIYRFYFDYVVNDTRLNLMYTHGLEHAVQVHVLGRDVVLYSRLMLNFSIETEEGEEVYYEYRTY